MGRIITANKFATFDMRETLYGNALRMRTDIARGKFPAGLEVEVQARALHAALNRFIAAYEAAEIVMPEAVRNA